jgi:hypothetical protein
MTVYELKGVGVFTIKARNVSEALWLGYQYIKDIGVPVNTRAGQTLEFPGPVATTYMYPRERVLFYPTRDANPFFHFMEGLWMLAGRNDVAFVTRYNKRMKDYSTNGETYWGAYGFRWRNWFYEDQLPVVIHRLKTYENDRRTVLAIWDGGSDLMEENDYKDIPCNTHIYFKVRDGKLNMTVCCRSNDLIWGAYGANAVHFSMLMEYIAASVGVEVGHYTQFSDSLHAYTDVLEKLKNLSPDYDPYLTLGADRLHYTPKPLVDDPDSFYQEVRFFCDGLGNNYKYKNSIFPEVAHPMERAYRVWKNGDKQDAIKVCEEITALDWRKACIEWLERRLV